MPLGKDPPFKKRACDPTDHEFVRNEHGYFVCEKCDLSRQSLTDQVGQRLV